MFAEPVADPAMLAGLDYQDLPDADVAWHAFIDARAPFRLGLVPDDGEEEVYVFTLDPQWVPCRARAQFGSGLWLSSVDTGIRGDMSRWSIIDVTGAALGVLSVSSGDGEAEVQPAGRNRE